MDCAPTRWPVSPRTVVQRVPWASNGPDHLGLVAISQSMHTTWTMLQNDGPDHLGLWCNAFHGHPMALITSDCGHLTVHAHNMDYAPKRWPVSPRTCGRTGWNHNYFDDVVIGTFWGGDREGPEQPLTRALTFCCSPLCLRESVSRMTVWSTAGLCHSAAAPSPFSRCINRDGERERQRNDRLVNG